MKRHFAWTLALMCAASDAGAQAGLEASGQCTTWGERGALLFQDDFHGPLLGYVAEYAHKPRNRIENRNGRLDIDVDSGATVWLDRPLDGNVLIAFTRRVVVDGGKNDRLSDSNMFWMASDPANATLFTRDGTLEAYDRLDLYYAGIGGNHNTTSRLRRYGDGQRTLVGEHLDAAHLLEKNHDYRVEIAVFDGCTRVRVDGADYFSYRDPQPLTRGYFGWRTTWSHQTIGDLKIWQLK